MSTDSPAETSTDFDLDGVAPFPEHLAGVNGVALASEVRTGIAQGVAALAAGSTGHRAMPITVRGADHAVEVGACMDDIEAPDLYFTGPEAVITVIDDALGDFADDTGW